MANPLASKQVRTWPSVMHQNGERQVARMGKWKENRSHCARCCRVNGDENAGIFAANEEF